MNCLRFLLSCNKGLQLKTENIKRRGSKFVFKLKEIEITHIKSQSL